MNGKCNLKTRKAKYFYFTIKTSECESSQIYMTSKWNINYNLEMKRQYITMMKYWHLKIKIKWNKHEQEYSLYYWAKC